MLWLSETQVAHQRCRNNEWPSVLDFISGRSIASRVTSSARTMSSNRTDKANIKLSEVLLRQVELIDQFQSGRKDDEWELSELKELGSVIHMAVNDVKKVFPWDLKPEDVPLEVPDATSAEKVTEPIRRIKDLANLKLNLG